jgi:chemotaxis protein MotB
MSRKKRPEEHANHERWLVSYADFITLLFAFFVVLYSSSQVDKRKVGQLATAIQVAFQQLGVFETSNSKMPLAQGDNMPFQNVQVIENIKRSGDLKHIIQPMSQDLANAALPPTMQSVRDDLERVLAPEIGRHIVALEVRREGLVVSLREVGFYESGSAELLPSADNAMDRLAQILSTRPENLRVEGHTDNVPIHTARYSSNWELSAARATELVKVLIDKYGFEPERLSAAGYAEFHPVDTNSTPEGRSHNRRVDILILSPEPIGIAPIQTAPATTQQPATTGSPSPSSKQ